MNNIEWRREQERTGMEFGALHLGNLPDKFPIIPLNSITPLIPILSGRILIAFQ